MAFRLSRIARCAFADCASGRLATAAAAMKAVAAQQAVKRRSIDMVIIMTSLSGATMRVAENYASAPEKVPVP